MFVYIFLGVRFSASASVKVCPMLVYIILGCKVFSLSFHFSCCHQTFKAIFCCHCILCSYFIIFQPGYIEPYAFVLLVFWNFQFEFYFYNDRVMVGSNVRPRICFACAYDILKPVLYQNNQSGS